MTDTLSEIDTLWRSCEARLQDIRAGLARQQASLAQELQAVRESLKSAGLASPEAIRTAYGALDAGEREHLQRLVRAQRGQDAAPPGPQAARRHRSRLL